MRKDYIYNIGDLVAWTDGNGCNPILGMIIDIDYDKFVHSTMYKIAWADGHNEGEWYGPIQTVDFVSCFRTQFAV